MVPISNISPIKHKRQHFILSVIFRVAHMVLKRVNAHCLRADLGQRNATIAGVATRSPIK